MFNLAANRFQLIQAGGLTFSRDKTLHLKILILKLSFSLPYW